MSKDSKGFEIQPIDEQALTAWKQRKTEENPATFFYNTEAEQNKRQNWHNLLNNGSSESKSD